VISIAESQYRALERSTYRKFEDSCVVFIGEHFPDLSAVVGEDGVRKRIRTDLQRADLIGVNIEPAMMKYMYLSLLLGNNFDLDPRYSWMKELSADPNTRMSAALDAVIGRIEQGHPLEHRAGI
jgi:hypothetical protein